MFLSNKCIFQEKYVINHFDSQITLYDKHEIHEIHEIAQNAAARLISGTMRHEHISGILRELHWLPATKRCQYKLLVLTYQALHGNLPSYICEMLHWYHPSRPLRSAAYPSLVPNKNKTVKFGRRLCNTATAVFWSNLPVHLRCAESVVVFTKQLKTHLFQVL